MKFEITLKYTYEPNLRDYGTNDPDAALAIDIAGAEGDPSFLMDDDAVIITGRVIE